MGGYLILLVWRPLTNHNNPVPSDWFLVGNGGMGYWDYYRGP